MRIWDQITSVTAYTIAMAGTSTDSRILEETLGSGRRVEEKRFCLPSSLTFISSLSSSPRGEYKDGDKVVPGSVAWGRTKQKSFPQKHGYISDPETGLWLFPLSVVHLKPNTAKGL